jgi:hypothetical protein
MLASSALAMTWCSSTGSPLTKRCTRFAPRLASPRLVDDLLQRVTEGRSVAGADIYGVRLGAVGPLNAPVCEPDRCCSMASRSCCMRSAPPTPLLAPRIAAAAKMSAAMIMPSRRDAHRATPLGAVDVATQHATVSQRAHCSELCEIRALVIRQDVPEIRISARRWLRRHRAGATCVRAAPGADGEASGAVWGAIGRRIGASEWRLPIRGSRRPGGRWRCCNRSANTEMLIEMSLGSERRIGR